MKNYIGFLKLLEEESIKTEYKDIINLDYEDFVKVLGEAAKDPHIKNLLSAGLKDGKPSDEAMKFTKETIKVTELRPTQREIDLDKSLKIQLSAKYPEQLNSILKGENIEIKGPIITLNSKYIIDGHHRWSQVYAINSSATMVCLNINYDITPIEALKAVQMAIAAKIGTVPVERVEGKNLFHVTKDEIFEYVKTNTVKYLYDSLVEHKKIKNKGISEVCKYIWANIEMLKKVSQPAKGAPDRDFMPQTEYAPNWEEELASGEINFRDPFNIKESLLCDYRKFIGILNRG